MNKDFATPDAEWKKVAAELVRRLSQAIAALDVVPAGQAPKIAMTLVDQAISAAKRALQENEAPSEYSIASAWGAISSLIEFLAPSAGGEDCPFDSTSADLRSLCGSFTERDEHFDFDDWSFQLIDLAVADCSLEFPLKQLPDSMETLVPAAAPGVQDDLVDDTDAFNTLEGRSLEARQWAQAEAEWLAIGEDLRNKGINSGLSMNEEIQVFEKAYYFARSIARKRFVRDPIEVLHYGVILLLDRLKNFDSNRPGSTFEKFLIDSVKHSVRDACDERSSTDQEGHKIIDGFYNGRQRQVPNSPEEVYADFCAAFRDKHERYHADEMDLREHGFLGETAIANYFVRHQLRNSCSFDKQVGDESEILAPSDTETDASSEVDWTKDSLKGFSRLLVDAEKELLALFNSPDENERRDMQIFVAWWAKDIPRLVDLLSNAGLPLPDSLKIDDGDRAVTQKEIATRFGLKTSSAINKIVERVSLRICAIIRTKNGSSTISADDLVDFPSLARKLKQPTRAFDVWLAGELSGATRAALLGYQGLGFDPATLQEALLRDLNGFLCGASIHESARFAGIAVRSETQTLMQQNPQGSDLQLLNRLLIEDAYPLEVSRNHKIPQHIQEGLRAAFPRAFVKRRLRSDPESEFRRALAIIDKVMKTEPPEHLADQALFYQVHFPNAVLNKLHPSNEPSSTRLIHLAPGIPLQADSFESVIKQYNLDATFALRRMKGIVRRVKRALIQANVSEGIWKALTKLASTDSPDSGIKPDSNIE